MVLGRARSKQTANQHHQVGSQVEGKWKRGHPRNTRQQDLEAEAKTMGYTWAQLKRMAHTPWGGTGSSTGLNICLIHWRRGQCLKGIVSDAQTMFKERFQSL